jgi:hypothetical protein
MVGGWLVSQRYYTLRLMILHKTGLPARSPHHFRFGYRLCHPIFDKRQENIAHLHLKAFFFTVQIPWNI